MRNPGSGKTGAPSKCIAPAVLPGMRRPPVPSLPHACWAPTGVPDNRTSAFCPTATSQATVRGDQAMRSTIHACRLQTVTWCNMASAHSSTSVSAGTSFPYDPRCPFETGLPWSSTTCLRGWTPSHAPLPAGVALTRFDLILEIPDLRSFEAPAVARSLLGPDLTEQCLGWHGSTSGQPMVNMYSQCIHHVFYDS